jgi:hypothetical protein
MRKTTENLSVTKQQCYPIDARAKGSSSSSEPAANRYVTNWWLKTWPVILTENKTHTEGEREHSAKADTSV